jgi:hypothetical protein
MAMLNNQMVQVITHQGLPFGDFIHQGSPGFNKKPKKARRIFCPGWSEARRTSSEVCWSRVRNGLQVRRMNGVLKHGQWDDGWCFLPSKMVMVDAYSIFV